MVSKKGKGIKTKKKFKSKVKRTSKKKIVKRKVKKSKTKKRAKITIKMKVRDIVKKYPKAREVLLKRGYICNSCGLPKAETLSKGALMHGDDPRRILELLNKVIK